MKREPMDRLLRQALAAQESSGKCPDESEVAAYLDSRLRPDERTRFIAHTAGCAECRETLALSMELEERAADRFGEHSGANKKLLFHFQVPASVLGLILIAAVASVLYFRGLRNTRHAPVAIPTAESHLPLQTITAPSPSAQAQVLKPAQREAGSTTLSRAGKEQRAAAAPTESLKEGEEPAGYERDAVFPGAVSEPVADVPQPKAAIADFSPGGIRRAPASLEQSNGIMKDRSAAQQYDYSAGSTRIGDRTFAVVAGIWVDSQIAGHPGAPAVEVNRNSNAFAEILKAYPQLAGLHPVKVFWKGRIVAVVD